MPRYVIFPTQPYVCFLYEHMVMPVLVVVNQRWISRLLLSLSLPSLPTLSIRYNLEGDLLFSVAKDSKPTVWYSSNGERLGTFNGHNGAIWCIDVNRILTTIY